MDEKYSDYLQRRNKRILLFFLGFIMISLGLFAYTLLITPQSLTIGFQNEIIVPDLLTISICIALVIIFGYFILILNERWDYEKWDKIIEKFLYSSRRDKNTTLNSTPQKCPRCGIKFSGDLCSCGYILINRINEN